MVDRVAAAALQIVRREDASEEADDGEAVLAVIPDRVEIPPGIAARRDGAIEARSFMQAATASRADKAAIGTPAPGWVLPPAQ
jgi:hypothetical protein